MALIIDYSFYKPGPARIQTENMNPAFLKILENKSWQDLDEKDKALLPRELTESEYHRMHETLVHSRKTLKDTPEPPAALKERLLEAMKARNKVEPNRPSMLYRALNHRIPLWQAAASILLLLGVVGSFRSEPRMIEKTDTVYVHQKDTIYLESIGNENPEPPVRKPSRVNKRPVQTDQDAVLIASSDSVSRVFPGAGIADTFRLSVSTPRGRSASQTRDLWDFYEEVY